MENDLTLVITTFNDGPHLRSAIESVLKQSCKPVEIIIVDDGSSDNEAQLITEELSKKEHSILITYIYQKNMGPSAARNTGILKTRTKYITFLDADDELTNDSLQLRLDKIKSCGDKYFGAYGSGITSERNKLEFIDFNGVPQPDMIGHYNTGIPGGSCYYVFTTDAIVKAGLYDETLRNNEDFDLIIRIVNLGLKCVGPICCSNFINVRKGSLSRTTNPIVSFEKTLEFLKKAKDLQYFTSQELNKRIKIAHLSCAKRLIINDPKRAAMMILKGFSYSRPRGIKENLSKKLAWMVVSFLEPMQK